MKNKIAICIVLIFYSFRIYSQITTTITSTTNSVCNGLGCNYNGPSILINEVMLSPNVFDGSIFGSGLGFMPNTNTGEWIELFNPDKCNSVDISCYFLGNSTLDSFPPRVIYPGGYRIPENTIVPPNGFCVIRGFNATPVPSNLLVQNGGNTIEIIVDTSRVCLGGGTRLWFPNAGGWFAFYNRNGEVQDAIYWNDTLNFCSHCHPCNPQGCLYTDSLSSLNEIHYSNKNYINSLPLVLGSSFCRIPDGGNWLLNTPQTPTIGNCNDTCITTPTITCNGTATVLVAGGTPPYSYHWHQGYLQTGATATGLCEGWNYVTITDANGLTKTDSVLVGLINFDATISVLSPIGCHDDNNASLKVIPIGGTLPFNFLWNNNSTNQTISNLSAGNYSVIIRDTNNCIDSAQITILNPDIISLNNIKKDAICNYDCNGKIIFSATGGQHPYTFFVNNIQYNDSLTGLCPANYIVKIIDINNCQNVENISINYLSSINALANISPLIGDEPLEVFFNNITPNSTTYNWNFGDGNFSFDENTSYTYLNYGDYLTYYIVSNAFGCSDTLEQKIVVNPTLKVFVPNIFTPNGDGFNDSFIPDLNYQVDKYDLWINNRWGDKLFYSNNQNINWDGTYKGNQSAEGVYFFILNIFFANIEYKYHGSVTLLR